MQKIKNLLFSTLFLFVLNASLFAQGFDRPNGFSGSILLIDHASFQEGNDFGLSGLTTGFEFAYNRHLNKFISVRVPFKGGILGASEFDFANNRSFVGIDLTVQATYFGNEAKVAPFVYAGFGGTKEESIDIYNQIPLGAGLNFRIGRWAFFQVKAEYRADLNNEIVRNNLQYGVGLVAVVGPTATSQEIKKMLSDTDGDGVEDDVDRCPDIAGKKQFGGCLDSDNDGIGDADDSCPDAIGLKALNGCPDADADGVADIVDNCPDIPGTADGCPDSDLDGVADIDDKCPELAGSKIFKGCPEYPEETLNVVIEEGSENEADLVAKGESDIDNDGFSGSEDECPDMAGSANGCPDADGDGVGDKFDACPNDVGSLAGCPDSDNDGIADYKDSCPTIKGSASSFGCPEENIATSNTSNHNNRNTYNSDNISYGNTTISKRALTLMADATRTVQFKTLSDDLTSSSFYVLDEVVRLMIDNPNYRLKVSGHTDDRGEDSVNQRLSEKRARACVRHLRSQGVPEIQMSYMGYGARIPISDNDTEYGRSENRRVEFELYIIN